MIACPDAEERRWHTRERIGGPMLQFLQHLLASYGYLAVAVGVMVESMGIPIPGETMLLLAAAYAGAGGLDVRGVIVAAALGVTVRPILIHERRPICARHRRPNSTTQCRPICATW